MSEPDETRVTDWNSIYVATVLAFCSAVQFSLYFTGMWPFLENIDKQATEEFFGFVVAGYSFAQCVVSPIFGYWSNRIKQISIPMYAGLGSMIFGNILYFSTEVFPSNRRFVMLIARFFLGIGSANLPLLRTYASTSCVPSDRALAIAYINGGISIGTTLGPGLQLIFSPIGYPGLRFLTGLGINMYTAPAFTACFVNILCCFLLKCYFTESYAGIIENSQESVLEKPRLPKFDKTAAAVCNITRFTQQFFFTNIELIGSPFAMTIFAFTRQETIQYGSIAQVALGAISLGNFFSYIGFKFSRFMRHRIAIMGALATLFVFHLATYPWAFIPGQLVTYNDSRLNTSEEHVGCNVNRFTWCDSMKPVNPWIYYIAFAICIGLAMPYIDISNNTVYGRILGPRRQGTMQGIMQFCGGLARFIGPMTVGVLYARYGPKAIWITEMGIIAVTGLLWVVFYKRMVELKVDETTTLTNLDVPSYGSEEERERL